MSEHHCEDCVDADARFADCVCTDTYECHACQHRAQIRIARARKKMGTRDFVENPWGPPDYMRMAQSVHRRQNTMTPDLEMTQGMVDALFDVIGQLKETIRDLTTGRAA